MAHENGSIESSHGHLKRAINDALLLRGSTDFIDLDAYRTFIDMIVGRYNAHRDKVIDSERTVLQGVAGKARGRLQTSLGSDHQLQRVHFQKELLCGAFTPERTASAAASVREQAGVVLGGPTSRNAAMGTRGQGRKHVVNYRYVIHSLRTKPMALAGLVYRDQTFPREAYRQAFEQLRDALGERAAYHTLVKLLSIAHERGVELYARGA